MWDRFWELLCSVSELWTVLLGLNAALLFMLVLSVPQADPESSTFVVGVMSAAIIVVCSLGLAFVVLRCRRRRSAGSRRQG
jgi:hypothetical protein